jgi:hypothetical protein
VSDRLDSQIAQPLGNTGSCISWSAAAASPPLSSGGSVSCAISFASSRKSKLRLLAGEENRPSVNSTLSAPVLSTSAAICLPLAISSPDALAMIAPAWRIERPE